MFKVGEEVGIIRQQIRNIRSPASRHLLGGRYNFCIHTETET